ncbi:hypothetical protein [Pseudothauera rhizosphaerae]|uniref:Uncharacterized protein n=1 Tax=Pseudothauera rhizosphaerae TaxID=2565932 RepID=A0A4S4AQK9_9RHOO|nr:hypothetical protein [Pseudothauera rhizosphaerae]THF62042.1 hypothetical protein E6O51_07725 [Pseudothauera rhizosphaerae]
MARRALLVAALLVVALLAWLRPLDGLAERYADAGLKRAVATFATARALNAVISVVQGTEVSGGVVVGVTLAPGQVLDPLNDLVEQFSSLMLAASIAFGAQLLLMKIGASWVISAVLSTAAIGVAWNCWRGRRPPAWLLRGFVALLLVRFIVPLAALGSELAYRAFMEEEYEAKQASIEGAEQSLRGLGAAADGERPRAWEFDRHIDNLKLAAERIVDDVIRIAVVFLLQTLVLPLLAMWLLVRLGAMLVRAPPGADSPINYRSG